MSAFLLQGCKAFKILNVDQRATYSSHNSVDDFIEAISYILEENTIKDCNQKCYALTCDESTDFSVTQNLIIYIRFIANGKIENHFLSLEELEGCDSVSIFNKLKSVLLEKDLPSNGLLILGTDGASVMTGCKSGVVTRFKDENPFTLSIHCGSHRLALAAAQAANADPFLVKYQDMHNAIYKYFHFSPKNQRSLVESQKALSEPLLKFKQVFGTRWLSFHDNVKTLLRNFDSLITTLLSDSASQNKNGRAQGLLKTIARFDFVAVTYYLSDVLDILNKLTLTLQTANLSYSDMKMLVSATVNNLNALKITDGRNLANFLGRLPADWETESVEQGSLQFKSHAIGISKQQVEKFKCVRDKYLKDLVANIDTRFNDDSNHQGEVFRAFDVLNPVSIREYTDKHVQDLTLTNYGEESIDKLSNFYGETKVNKYGTECKPLISKENFMTEFGMFKHIMVKYKALSFTEFWCIALQKFKPAFPNVCILGEIYLCMPPTSVDAERGFSCQNLIKTALRSNLTIPNLNKLMLIKLEGPNIHNFNFNLAFQRWCNSKDRRIFQIQKKMSVSSSTCSSTTNTAGIDQGQSKLDDSSS